MQNKVQDKKEEILHELSQLLVSFGSRAAMWGDIIDDFDERKQMGENAKRKRDAIQTAMIMVDRYYGKN